MIPKSDNAQGACSLEEPQPKFLPANKILDLLKKDKVRPSSANDKLIFYRRDKGSRFQYVFENRLVRIEKEIAGLNNLHSKANYRYSQEDFREGEERLRRAISKFNRRYNEHFILADINKKKRQSEQIEDIE